MDADRPERRKAPGIPGGRIARGLRLAGMVLQLLLCVALTVWAVAAREAVLGAVAAALAVVASAVLVIHLRGRAHEPD